MKPNPFEINPDYFSKVDDRTLIDYARLCKVYHNSESTYSAVNPVEANTILSVVNTIDENTHIIATLISELKVRILNNTKGGYDTESTIFQDIEMSVNNLANYLMVLISKDYVEVYTAIQNLTGLTQKESTDNQLQIINGEQQKTVGFEFILTTKNKILRNCLSLYLDKDVFVQQIIKYLGCVESDSELKAFHALTKKLSYFSVSFKLDSIKFLLNKLPSGEPNKLEKLAKVPEIECIIRLMDECITIKYLSFAELQSLTKDDFSEYKLEIFQHFEYVRFDAFLQSSSKLADLRSLYLIFDFSHFRSVLNRYLIHINSLNELYHKYIDPQFIEFSNHFAELSYLPEYEKSIKWGVDEDERKQPSDKVIFALYLQDKSIINSFIRIIKILTLNPFIPVREDFPWFNCPYYKSFLFKFSYLSHYVTTLKYIQLIDLFEYPLLKQFFIIQLERDKGFVSELGEINVCLARFAQFATFCNKADRKTLDQILHQRFISILEKDDNLKEISNDDEIDEGSDSKQNQSQYDYRNSVFPNNRYIAFFDQLRLAINKIINHPTFLNELCAIDQRLLESIVLKYTLDQLIALSDIKSTDKNLKHISLLTAITHPDLVRWLFFKSFDEIKSHATDIFCEYSFLLQKSSQRLHSKRAQADALTVSVFGVFSSQINQSNNTAEVVSNIPTDQLIAEVKRRNIMPEIQRELDELPTSDSCTYQK